jgi:hypothetical protein
LTKRVLVASLMGEKAVLLPLSGLPPDLEPELCEGSVGEAGPLHQVRGLGLPLGPGLKIGGPGLAYIYAGGAGKKANK